MSSQQLIDRLLIHLVFIIILTFTTAVFFEGVRKNADSMLISRAVFNTFEILRLVNKAADDPQHRTEDIFERIFNLTTIYMPETNKTALINALNTLKADGQLKIINARLFFSRDSCDILVATFNREQDIRLPEGVYSDQGVFFIPSETCARKSYAILPNSVHLDENGKATHVFFEPSIARKISLFNDPPDMGGAKKTRFWREKDCAKVLFCRANSWPAFVVEHRTSSGLLSMSISNNEMPVSLFEMDTHFLTMPIDIRSLEDFDSAYFAATEAGKSNWAEVSLAGVNVKVISFFLLMPFLLLYGVVNAGVQVKALKNAECQSTVTSILLPSLSPSHLIVRLALVAAPVACVLGSGLMFHDVFRPTFFNWFYVNPLDRVFFTSIEGVPWDQRHMPLGLGINQWVFIAIFIVFLGALISSLSLSLRLLLIGRRLARSKETKDDALLSGSSSPVTSNLIHSQAAARARSPAAPADADVPN